MVWAPGWREQVRFVGVNGIGGGCDGAVEGGWRGIITMAWGGHILGGQAAAIGMRFGE